MRDKEKQRLYQQEYRKTYIRPYESEMKRRASRSERVKRNQEWLAQYKQEKGCFDCGYNKHPSALEFDHLRDKFKDISDMVKNGFSIKRLQEEIDKCEVVCSNCHRIRT